MTRRDCVFANQKINLHTIIGILFIGVGILASKKKGAGMKMVGRLYFQGFRRFAA